MKKYAKIFIEMQDGVNTLGRKLASTSKFKPFEVATKSYKIAKYPVTQEIYEEVMGVENFFSERTSAGPLYPARLHWIEAIEFCNAFSLRDKLNPCYQIETNGSDDKNKWIVACDFNKNGYRLPTAAEWEFAAKDYSIKNIKEYGETKIFHKTKKIGQKKPNVFGLCDLYNEGGEFCWDRYGSSRQSVSRPSFDACGVSESKIIKGIRPGADTIEDIVVFNKEEDPHILFGLRLVRSL